MVNIELLNGNSVASVIESATNVRQKDHILRVDKTLFLYYTQTPLERDNDNKRRYFQELTRCSHDGDYIIPSLLGNPIISRSEAFPRSVA